MSQWGDTIGFVLPSGCVIRVISHVKTAGFDPGGGDSIVDDLMLINVSGDRDGVAEKLAELKSQFVGKPYREWLKEAGSVR